MSSPGWNIWNIQCLNLIMQLLSNYSGKQIKASILLHTCISFKPLVGLGAEIRQDGHLLGTTGCARGKFNWDLFKFGGPSYPEGASKLYHELFHISVKGLLELAAVKTFESSCVLDSVR